MPAELRPDGDGWTCPEHPAYAPLGLTPRHALNSQAKHNREMHADDEVAALAALLRDLPPGSVDQMAAAIVNEGWHRAPF